MNYTKALKIIRTAKGLSQQEFAKKVGLSNSLVSRIESGERNLSKKTLVQISKKLDVPTSLISLLSLEITDENKFEVKDMEKLGRVLLKIIHEPHA